MGPPHQGPLGVARRIKLRSIGVITARPGSSVLPEPGTCGESNVMCERRMDLRRAAVGFAITRGAGSGEQFKLGMGNRKVCSLPFALNVQYDLFSVRTMHSRRTEQPPIPLSNHDHFVKPLKGLNAYIVPAPDRCRHWTASATVYFLRIHTALCQLGIHRVVRHPPVIHCTESSWGDMRNGTADPSKWKRQRTSCLNVTWIPPESLASDITLSSSMVRIGSTEADSLAFVGTHTILPAGASSVRTRHYVYIHE